jgi:hypothetical protein
MKLSSALLGIGLVAVSGLAFHFWQKLEEERQQVAILASKEPERQPPTAASPVPTPAHTSTIAEPPLQASTEPQLSGSPERDARIAAFTRVREAAEQQVLSPEGRAQSKSHLRERLKFQYPDVDQALGLTTEEADKLLDLIADQRMRSSSVMVMSPKNAQEREAAQRRARETAEREDAELQALLGSKHVGWKDYQEILPAWVQRRELRAVVNAAGFPLTNTQDDALINALSAEQRIINQTRTSTTQGNSNGLLAQYTPENRQRLVDAVAPYMSPQQLDGYKGLLERKAAQEQATLSVRLSSGIDQ